MAMLFMVIFSTLALGFYASTTMSVQVARNDQRTAKALLAAESGVQFMRYHLANVTIPPNSPNPLADLCSNLQTSLNGSMNLGSNHVSLVGNTIYIPVETGGYISTNTTDASGFTACITDHGGNIVCTVTGRSGLSASAVSDKAVSLDFTRQAITTSVFNYAVASKGQVTVSKGTLGGVTGVSPNSIATLMSAKGSNPAFSISGGTIGGDINVTASGLASVTGGSVGGSSNVTDILANHTHVVADPTFPVFDTTVFAQYATNAYGGATGGTLTNVIIPPNTNPKFTGNTTIQGILYIQSPNTVTFRGNTTLQGFIVFENAGTTSNNVISMSGNFSEGTLPAGSQFDALRTTTGIAILAPTTTLTMSGSTDSQVRGNMILGTFENGGAANVEIDQGTLMTLNTTSSSAAYFHGAKTVKWTSTGQNNKPSQGVSYNTMYVPVGGSYRELN